MAQVVIFDPNDLAVPNRVTNFDYSANLPDYDSEPNKLVNPDLTGFWNLNAGFLIPLKDWKVESSLVVEMTVQEKETLQQSFESNEVNIVRVLEQDPEQNIEGKHKADGFRFDIPAANGTYKYSITYVYDVSILSMDYTPTPDQTGNTFSVRMAPNTVVGAVTQDVNIGDTVISVSPTVLENIFPGYLVSVGGESLGYVITKDVSSGTIEVEIPATQSHLASSPSFVSMTVESIKEVTFSGGARVDIGATKIGSSFLPRGTLIVITYEQTTGVAHFFSGIIEYLY